MHVPLVRSTSVLPNPGCARKSAALKLSLLLPEVRAATVALPTTAPWGDVFAGAVLRKRLVGLDGCAERRVVTARMECPLQVPMVHLPNSTPFGAAEARAD